MPSFTIDAIACLSGIVSFAQENRQSALRLYVPANAHGDTDTKARASHAAQDTIFVFMRRIIPYRLSHHYTHVGRSVNLPLIAFHKPDSGLEAAQFGKANETAAVIVAIVACAAFVDVEFPTVIGTHHDSVTSS